RASVGTSQEGGLRSSATPAEARMALDAGEITIGTPVRIRLTDTVPTAGAELPEGAEPDENGLLSSWTTETTLGRVLFNDALPEDYPFVNQPVDTKRITGLVKAITDSPTEVQR